LSRFHRAFIAAARAAGDTFLATGVSPWFLEQENISKPPQGATHNPPIV
jgi:hypothetical protein